MHVYSGCNHGDLLLLLIDQDLTLKEMNKSEMHDNAFIVSNSMKLWSHSANNTLKLY